MEAENIVHVVSNRYIKVTDEPSSFDLKTDFPPSSWLALVLGFFRDYSSNDQAQRASILIRGA